MVITIFANIAYLRDFQPTKRVQVPFSALNENPGSLVIEDFRDSSLNNWIRPDRKHETRFFQEKSLLELSNDKYILSDGLQPSDNRMSYRG